MKPTPTVSVLIFLLVSWLLPGPAIPSSAAGEPETGDEREQARAVYEPIWDYIHHRLCLFYEAHGESRRGAECQEILYNTYPDSPLRSDALFRAAQLYRESGEFQRAADLYADFLRRYPDNRRIPEVHLGLGLIAYEEGRYRVAGDAFRKIRVEYPAASADETAGKYLDEVRKKDPDYPGLTLRERLERAKELYKNENYRKAVDAYEKLLATGQFRGKDREEAMFTLARSHDHLREWDAAAKAYQSYLKRYSGGRHAPEALFRSGRIHLKQDKDDAYLQAYRRYLKKYPSGKYRDEIRYGLALFYSERGETGKAKASLDKILDKNSRGEWRAKALWEKGWIAYRQGDDSAAVDPWDRLSRLPDPGFKAMALYWQGRGLERMGDRVRAEERFRTLCDRFPRSYYCLAAGTDLFGGGESYSTDTASEADSPFGGLRVNGTYMEIWPDIPAEITHHPGYRRIEALSRVGMLPEAAREARMLRKEFGEDRSRLLPLAYLLLRLGDTPHALDILQTHFSQEIVQGGMETDLPFRRMAFPLDYADWIASYAEPLGVDPALAAALIREESWFNPGAVSPAGALGLMQLMPATAKRILAAVPDPPSSAGPVSSLLVDPEWNIRLGVRFLADMLARFNGEIVFAVAAYNAGPGAVDRWIRTIPADAPDEFVESIPYPETRQYVKRVLRSYAEYRRAFRLGS